jgi:glycosyltransferase involved in cell wall biosynthesis
MNISVIIPTYNRAAFVVDAVASALTQTAPAREIIVIDDGSTDQTAAALAPYSSRIQYVHRENRGKAAARNAGIKMASSDWVAFLDSDDVWYPEWIEIVDTFLTERSAEVDLVFSNYSEWNADNTITESPLEKKKLFPVFQRYGLTIDRLMPAACAVRVRERTIKCRLGAISSHLFLGNFVPTSGVVCRRSACASAGYFHEAFDIAEDWDFWLRLSRRRHSAYLDLPSFKYRFHQDQAIHTSRRVKETIVSVIERNMALLEAMTPDVRRLALVRVARAYRERARGRLMSGDGAGARRDIRQSLQYRPSATAVAYLAGAILPGSVVRITVEQGRRLKHLLRH